MHIVQLSTAVVAVDSKVLV